MKLTFDIQPSKILLRWLIVVHMLAGFTIGLFFVSLIFKLPLILLVVWSALRQLKLWRTRAITLEFDTTKECWRVSKDQSGWRQVDKVQTVYVAEQFIWLNFYTINRQLVTAMVGVDSMDAAKIIQLRRSVICPAVLGACSA